MSNFFFFIQRLNTWGLFVSVLSVHLQFIGTWYEVERSFYLPELASSCTMLTFENEGGNDANNDVGKANDTQPTRLEVAVKSINQW